MNRKHPFLILLGALGWFALQPLLSTAVVFLAMAAYLALAGPGPDLADWYGQTGNLWLLAANALMLAAIRLAAGRRGIRFGRFTGLETPMGGGRAVLLCAVGGIAANAWFTRVLNSGIVPDAILDSYAEAYQLLEGGSLWVAFLATVLAAPLVEELVYRGLILRRLRAVMPAGAAIAGQAILFGLAHGNLLWGLYAGVLGAVLGYLTLRGGGLRVAVCFHMAFNAGAYLYGLFGTGPLGLLVSGALFLGAVIGLCKAQDRLVS